MQKEMTRVEMREESIRQYLENLIGDFETEKANFVERFQQHPTSTIGWNADDVVVAETQARLANQILSIFLENEETSFIEACKFVLNRVEEELLNMYGGSSTNPYSNANDKYEKEAYSRFYRRMNMNVDRLESAIADEQEQEDLKENVTDTTVYALRAHYCNLLNQVQSYLRMQDIAKTQRDQKAAFEGLKAVNNAIQDLSKLAEGLGINLTNTES